MVALIRTYPNNYSTKAVWGAGSMKRHKIRHRNLHCYVCRCLVSKHVRRNAHRDCLGDPPSVRRAMQDPLAELAPLIWRFIGGERLDGVHVDAKWTPRNLEL